MASLTSGAGPPSPRTPRPASSSTHTYCRAILLGLPAVGKTEIAAVLAWCVSGFRIWSLTTILVIILHTALTVRLLTKRFIGEYCPTLESLYCYRETVENEDVRMEIFDTAGITAEDTAPEAYILWANCFLLVYAINDRRSFDEVARLKRRIDVIKDGESPPCVLVGNKSDLEYERRVRRYEGQRLARLLGCTHFFETSACDGNHVSHIADMFHTLHTDFRRHRALLAGDVGTNSGRGAAPPSGTRHKPEATSTKFRHAIQKVIMRSKGPQKPPSLSKVGPARESIV